MIEIQDTTKFKDTSVMHYWYTMIFLMMFVI